MTHPTPPPRRAALRVLLVEDNPVDAELIVRSLRDAGFDPAVRRVETEAGYLAALAEAPDLILSDFGLPSFNGFEALELLRNRCLDTPFILISGTLGEDLVVKAIKRGADDYLMKDHLVRLGPAVEQVLRAKSLRDEARRAALERQRMVDTHAAVLDALPAHIALLDERGVIVTVNETWRRFAAENGSQPDRDGVGCNYLEVCERAVGGSAEGALAVADGIRAVLRGELAEFSHEYPCHSPVEPRWFRLIVSPQSQNRPGGAVVTHVNITARKRAEDTLQASHREYEQHHAALLQLARSPALQGNAEAAALAEITSTLAQAVKAARVSFWSFAPDRSAIVCRDLFHAPTAGHAAGQVLRAADFPGYFQALAANDIIAADDARSDPRTREFAATYLEPEGITSMLDAPVLVGGVLEGVLCIEHVGPVRHWTVSECNLAMAVSSLVAQLLARSAQARSEAQLRAILDNEPECVMAVGLDGRLLDMNPAGLRMIEADDRATVVGRPFVDLVHPDDRARFQALHRRVVAGENGRLQFRIRGLLGTERWMDTHATPLSSAQGAIDAVLSVTRDITEQRRVEAALKDSEERHRLLFLNNPIPSWVYDLETLRFLGVNDAAVAKYGYTREEFLGMTVKDIRPAEDVPALLKDIASVPRGVVSSGIWRHRLKSGQIIQVEIKGHVLEFDGRRTELILATDVTDRLRAEEEKRQALERERIARQEAETARRYYQLLFEYAPGCYVVLQPDDYQIVAVSEAYLKATMTRRDEIQGRRLFEVFPDMPADPEADGTRKVRESLERVKALGRSDVMAVQRYPIRRPQPDGGLWEERYWSCVNTPVPGPEGRIAFIIHRVEDVTEYIRAGPSAGNAPDAQSVLDTRASQMEADIMLRSFELKRANEELARSQALLRIAGRTARLGGWAWELEPEILTWSDETCGIHDRPAGYQPTLAEGLSYYADEHRARIETLVRHSAATGEPFEFEAELVTAKGRRIWVRSSGEALKDEAGRVRAMQGAIQDITVHKRQEAERETLRRRNAALVTALGEIVYEWRPAEDRLVWDGNFTAVLGYSRKEMGNRTAAWTARVHPDDLAAVMKAVEVAVDEHRNYSFEYRLRRKDGTYLWMRDSGVVFVDAQGRLERIIGVLTDVSVRREGEERTRTLALRLQRTLESITDAFFTVDRAWRFSYLNPAAERLLGRSADSLLGREIWHEFPASVGTEFERNYRRAARDNVAAHFQEYYPAPLNAWYDVRAYPSDEGLAVYFQDVSTQRRQQQALRESEERFRLLANATNDAIWDWDLATDALWWNEGFETLFGFSRAEVEPTIVSWTSRVHPADHDAVVADVQRAIEAGDVFWSSEYRFRRKDGSYAFVLDRGHILRDAAGKGMRMIGGMTDLTERRKTEERLREQASLLDAAQDAIFVSDPEHRLIYCNHSAERLYGWRADEMIGRSARELLHTDAAQFDAAVQQLLADGKWSGPLVQRKRDGGTIEVEGRWTLMRDAANQPKSVLVVNTDITERKKLEQQFLRAQRLESIGTLAGGIAHDLNNLLAPITMGVQLLRHFEPRAESKPIIDNIERAAGRGASLVKQVLSFARGVEGARVAVQVRHIVREVESILANTFPKSIRVTSSLPSGLWLVTGDPTQLNQTLLNLCVNARDAMPHGGTLTLAAENIEIDAQYAVMNRDAAPGRYVVLSVTDTGTGIPREILDRIFDPFFTTKDVGQGTGLGLSTVLGIVRSHGGFVNVHSEVGKGSTFRVHLPVQQGGDAAVEADAGESEALPRGKGELVLVVDDEAPILEVTKQTLEAFGYRVITSEDGAQAVGQFALARDEIAVVLTDMMMPVMDGPALISALRHIDPKVRIVAASGLNASENVARASSLGVKHFLAKPYSASTLLDALHRVLTEKGNRRSR